MKYKDFRKLNEADDRVIASVEFTDGTKITIRNIPKAATQSSGFEGQIRAKAAKAKPNLSFSSWSIVGDAEADKIDAPGGGYTPTAEEETDMKNVQALWDHVRSRSKAATPFTFTDNRGKTETIENPAEILDSEAAFAGSMNNWNILKKKVLNILKADENITTVGPAQTKQKEGEPLRITIAPDSFQYVRAIVYNTGDK
tara:strand:+ start:1439 stop:2035 length:597 start_codon:yes stop_codon:yes gene_type:complete